jgi:succinyl-CoA synthetase beta subunit
VQLNEHLSKTLLDEFGIPINEGYVASTADDAVAIAESLGYPVGIKAQVPASGRGKAGGILPAQNASEARNAFEKVRAVAIGGYVAQAVRVERWAPPDLEVYLAATISTDHGGPVVLFSPTGGIDVESGEAPTGIAVRSDGSLDGAAMHRAATNAGIPAPVERGLLQVARAMLRAFVATDARLIELNPIGVFGARLEALDARVIIDDNALFRQTRVASQVRASAPRAPEDLERERSSLEYVPLDGAIGLISGGAGMTLAVMDLISDQGERPACFLDCSANPTRDGYRRAFEILAQTPSVEATLVSVFGGLTLVDKVASNLCELLAEGVYAKPVTFRLMGVNVERAEEILAAAGHHNHRTLESAVASVVSDARAERLVASSQGGAR